MLTPASAILIATADLSLVRAIRSADRLATLGAANTLAHCPLDSASTLAPRYEPRPVVHPEPRYEARPVHLAPDVVDIRYSEALPAPCPPEGATPSTPSTIQPPWKVLLYKSHPLPNAAARDHVRQKITLRPIQAWPAGAMIDYFC